MCLCVEVVFASHECIHGEVTPRATARCDASHGPIHESFLRYDEKSRVDRAATRQYEAQDALLQWVAPQALLLRLALVLAGDEHSPRRPLMMSRDVQLSSPQQA